nr:hypothetical protein [Caldivirga sp.]
MWGCPAWGFGVSMCPHALAAYPRVPRIWEWGQLPVRDRDNGPKARPVVYRWTSRAR